MFGDTLVAVVDVPGIERCTVAQWANIREGTEDAAQILIEENRE
jgi:hypothetical protein